MQEKRYIAYLCGFVAGIVALVAVFNWLVNPLGIYNPPVVKGLNDLHPAAELYAFINKVETVKRLKPDALITGTSRAEICLDPKPEFFPGLKPYNFALASASVHEQRMALEFAQAVQPLKLAVVTLDFFAFDARKKDTPAYDPARLDPASLSPLRSLGDTYSPLVALDTVGASFKQIKFMDALDRYPYLKDNGTKITSDFDYIARKAGAGWPFARGRYADPDADTATRAIGSRAMTHFRAMIDFAYKNNIDMRFVILPLHQSYFDMMKATGQDDFHKVWEQRLRRVLRDAAEAAGKPVLPLLDFSTHRHSGEKVPEEGDLTTPMRWFWDPGHCKAALGDLVLRKVTRDLASRSQAETENQ